MKRGKKVKKASAPTPAPVTTPAVQAAPTKDEKPLADLKRKVHVAVFLMVKNEEKRIHVSLNSVKEAVSSVVIFDTGSTDNTIEVLRKWCDEAGLPLRLKQGTFVDFSTSRNEGLAFANTFSDIEYLLLLDSNDELKHPRELLELCIKSKSLPQSGFHLTQEWYWGPGKFTKYQNIRLIKPRCNWWYRGVVHEYLNRYVSPDAKADMVDEKHLVMATHIEIYQDRIADNDKSLPRFKKDKELLLAEVTRDPKDSRSMFYLAQSCECLGESEDALYYYRLRSQMDGYEDERFHAFLRAGDNAERLGHDMYDVIKWYLKAYHHSKRAEPLVKIGNLYQRIGDHASACMFYAEACRLGEPEARLFVDTHSYTYSRHNRMGISAFYAGRLEEGKLACMRAAATGEDRGLNESNLQFYHQAEADLAKRDRNAYLRSKVAEWLETHPGGFWEEATMWAVKEHERVTKKGV